MRQIDNMTPNELDTLALKGMTAPCTASERPAPAQHSRGWLPGMSRDELKATCDRLISERDVFSHAAQQLKQTKAHADKLAEACKSIAKLSEGWTSEQMNYAISKAQSALAAYEAAQ